MAEGFQIFDEDIYEDGNYRKIVPATGKTNTLLVRPQLGKVKATTYDLPGDEFVYGRSEKVLEAGAAGSVNNWQEHRPNAAAIPNRDFVRLNKYAAVNGVTTSKETADFRAVNDIRQPPANLSAPTNAYFPPPDTTFGKASPASDHFMKLLQNDHQRKWIVSQRNKKAAQLAEAAKPKSTKLQHTKASIGHTKVPAPEPKKQFKLKQFNAVPSRALALAGLKTIKSEPVEEKTAEEPVAVEQ